MLAANVITEEDHERMGTHGSVAQDAEKASRIADAVEHKLMSMNAGSRVLANLSISKQPKKLAKFGRGVNADDIDVNELYSTTYEWLEEFARFCRSSGGFEVM